MKPDTGDQQHFMKLQHFITQVFKTGKVGVTGWISHRMESQFYQAQSSREVKGSSYDRPT